VLFVAGLVGAFLTGLYTFRMVWMVFLWEPSPHVREHAHGHGHREGPFWMTGVVGVLALLALGGGWIQFAGVWTPVSDWIAPVARPLVEASGTKETIASILAVSLGLLGIGVAWWTYGARKYVPRTAALQTLF